MGIQFVAGIEATDPLRPKCYCGGMGPIFASPEEFGDFIIIWREAPYLLEGCTGEDCLEDVPMGETLVKGEELLSVDVAVGNQAVVLETLGLEDDFGSLPADDFEGRMLMALAIAPESAEIPAHELTPAQGETGPRWIECGRAAGYVQDKLVQLIPVVEQARRLDRPVTWG